jgi:phosphohistidine phosphatase
MALRLKKRGPEVQRIVSSSARRAIETARTFAEVLGMNPQEIVIRPAIYGAGVAQMVDLIRGLETALHRVLIVGHNPTFSELARQLSGEDFDELPTCAVITLEHGFRIWKSAGRQTFALRDADFPKK